MGWRGTWTTVGFHMTQVAPFLSAGAQSGVFRVPVACRARGCLHNYTDGLGSSPAEEDITPGGGAGSQCPSRGCNILGCARGCSCFANIPRMEEISDQCS